MSYWNTSTPGVEKVINRAASEGRNVSFIYAKPGEDHELRELLPDLDQPIRLSKGGDKYVIGHDPRRDGARNFRLDRIREATIL